MRVIALVSLLLIAACATPEEQIAAQQARDAADHNQCVKLGFKPLTDAFGDCRLRLLEMRQQERLIRAQSVSTHVTYGYSDRHHHWR